MSKKNVAILGCSGAVGRQMLTCLEERDFEVGDLKLLASKSSAGTFLSFKGEKIEVEEATEASFENVDIVLSAVENDVAKMLIPSAVAAGATVIDNSSAYRLDKNVPLVVADVNPQDIALNSGIIANPNCATIIAMLCIAPLDKIYGARRIICSTYQAASGAGLAGMNELFDQIKCIANECEMQKPHAFCDQLVMNLIPQIGSFVEDGYSTEEMKMQNEGRKILHNANLSVNCTCVRVPIARSHSESITVEFENDIDLDEVRRALSHAPGVNLIDDIDAKNARDRYPMPLYTTNQDLVFVGRIRRDISSNKRNSLSFWCTGDQIRIGAASNAVMIAEKLE